MCMCVHALLKASKENTAKQQSAGGLGQGSPLTPCRVKRYKAALSGPAAPHFTEIGPRLRGNLQPFLAHPLIHYWAPSLCGSIKN